MRSTTGGPESQENTQRSEATNCFMEARLALKNNETRRAEKLLRQAITLWPDNYNYTLQLAKVVIQLDRSASEVEELLLRSSALNLSATEPRLLMAAHFEKKGDLGKAVSIYKSVLNLDPNNLIVRRRMGQLNIDLSLGMSLNAFLSRFNADIAKSLEPPSIDGEAEELLEEPAEAPFAEEAALSEQGEEFTEEFSEASFNPDLAETKMYVSEQEDRAENFVYVPEEEIRHHEPQTSPQTSVMESLPFELNQESLQKSLSLKESNWESFLESVQYDSQMIEMDGTMRLNVGISYIEIGLHEEAIDELEEAWRLYTRKGDPEALRCCRPLVDCHLAMGHYKEAAEWAEKGLQLAQRDSEEGLAFLDELIDIYKRLGDDDRANELRDELNAISPGYRDVASIGTQLDQNMLDQEVVSARFALRPVLGISGEDFYIDESLPEVSIGRSDRNDIIIESLRVSKDHARLHFASEGIFIKSLSKTNGTYLNGERIELGREYRVEIGDRIGLGKTIEMELIAL